MAKILISYYWPYKMQCGISPTMCFYDGLRIGLQQRNHDVLEINHANFTSAIPSQDPIMYGSTLEYQNCVIKNKISTFNPDLIIAFNHAITTEMYKMTNCYILVWEGDSPISNFWYNKQLMLNKLDRIKFTYTIKKHFEIYKKFFKISPKNCFKIKLATACIAEKMPFAREISFLGSIHSSDINPVLLDYLKKASSNLNLRKQMISIIKHTLKSDLYHIPKTKEFPKLDFESLFFYIAEIKRTNLLKTLMLDFDFEFFGWTGLPINDPLYLYFNKTPTFSVEHNQIIYNTSKISINITQAQSNTNLEGYSWRVCDILATNACLVSSESLALINDFGKWVKIPMFSNAYEAYTICKKLLANEQQRADIVAASQLAIKEGKFTFYDRAQEIEDFFQLAPKVNDNILYEFLVNKDYDLKTHSLQRLIKNILVSIYYLNIDKILKKLNLDLDLKIKKIIKSVLLKY